MPVGKVVDIVEAAADDGTIRVHEPRTDVFHVRRFFVRRNRCRRRN